MNEIDFLNSKSYKDHDVRLTFDMYEDSDEFQANFFMRNDLTPRLYPENFGDGDIIWMPIEDHYYTEIWNKDAQEFYEPILTLIPEPKRGTYYELNEEQIKLIKGYMSL